jgi:competence ComEA-like helix-hairpin-helix protein
LSFVAVAVMFGAAMRLRSRAAESTFDCPPEHVSLDDDGVARCLNGEGLPAGQALTAGQKLDLNRVSATELELLPGVGPALASAIVAERDRRGGFVSWQDVGRVTGVGYARLTMLQRTCELGRLDAGV